MGQSQLDQRHAIFNHPDWPRFRWRQEALDRDLAGWSEEEELLANKLKYIEGAFLVELRRISLYEELISSLELDDEYLEPEAIKATLAEKPLVFRSHWASDSSPGTRFLSADPGPRIAALIDLHLDARANPEKRLSTRRLTLWRRALTQPGSLAGLGSWRGPAFGLNPARPGSRPYALEPLPAPVAKRIPLEMDRFFNWHNAPWPHHLTLKAALTHLWLWIAQPYAGGSGHLARLAADLALAGRGEIAAYYSLSQAISRDRENYHATLAATINSPNLDVTPWLLWFLKTLRQAGQTANARFDLIITQAARWSGTQGQPLSQRQKNALALLEVNFLGPLNPRRYARLTKCDLAVAERELNELVARGLIDPKFLSPTDLGPKPGRQDLGLF
jgi:Fic family protein